MTMTLLHNQIKLNSNSPKIHLDHASTTIHSKIIINQTHKPDYLFLARVFLFTNSFS